MCEQKIDAVWLLAAYAKKNHSYATNANLFKVRETLDLDISSIKGGNIHFVLTFNQFRNSFSLRKQPSPAQLSHITCIQGPGGKRQEQAGSICFWPPRRQCVTVTGNRALTPLTPRNSGWTDRNSAKPPISNGWFIHRFNAIKKKGGAKRHSCRFAREMCCGSFSNRLLTEYNHYCIWSCIILNNNRD